MKASVDLPLVQELAAACGTAACACSPHDVARAAADMSACTAHWHAAAVWKNAFLAEGVGAHELGQAESEDSEMAELQELPAHTGSFADMFGLAWTGGVPERLDQLREHCDQLLEAQVQSLVQ